MAMSSDLDKSIIGDKNIMTHDHEEAAKNVDEQAEVLPFTPEEGEHLKRTYDKWVLGTGFLIFTLAYLDRANIGNANAAGMSQDLGLTASMFQWLLNVFYIPYLLFQFATICWKIFDVRWWASILLFCWGLASMMMGVANNFSTLMALRFLLGMVEALMSAGIPLYLSFFYYRHELGVRIGILLGSSPFAVAWASALAYGLTSIKGTIAGWRILFLVEGAPTIIAAPFIFFLLAKSPREARFLTPRQKEVAVARDAKRAHDRQHGEHQINWKLFFAAFWDYKSYFNAALHFCGNVSFASINVFLPTIIKSLGYSAIRAQGLTTPPFLFAFFCVIFVTWLSDRYRTRGIVVALAAFMGGTGYLINILTDNVGARYFAIYLCTGGIFSAIVTNVAWTLNNHGTGSKRGAALTIFQVIGQCGSFVGTATFPSTDAPRYRKGLIICCCFMYAITALAAVYSLILRWENKRRDEKFGKVTGLENPIDISETGDKHPGWRYIP